MQQIVWLPPQSPTPQAGDQNSTKLYEKAYSALDIIEIIYNSSKIENKRKFGILIYFDKVRKEFRNEILLLSFVINVVFMRPELYLENIKEM